MISSEQVKFMRLQHGWSQQQLASITDISVRTIQRIEKNSDCSLESKMALASAFGVAPNELDMQKNITISQHSQKLSAWLYLSLCIFLLAIVYWSAGTLQVLIYPKIILVFVVLFCAMSFISSGINSVLKILNMFHWLLFGKFEILSPHIYVKSLHKQINHAYAAGIAAYLFNGLLLFSRGNNFDMTTLYIQLTVSLICAMLYSVLLAELILRPFKQKLEMVWINVAVSK